MQQLASRQYFVPKKDRKRVEKIKEEKKAATSMQCMFRRRQAKKEVQKKREERHQYLKEEKKKIRKETGTRKENDAQAKHYASEQPKKEARGDADKESSRKV